MSAELPFGCGGLFATLEATKEWRLAAIGDSPHVSDMEETSYCRQSLSRLDLALRRRFDKTRRDESTEEHKMSTPKKTPSASIVWFEIPADNPKRAKAFYASLFGWKISPFPGMADY